MRDLRGVEAACRDGLSPEEVQSLFKKMLEATNTKRGRKAKRALRFLAGAFNYAKGYYMNKQNADQATIEKVLQYTYPK